MQKQTVQSIVFRKPDGLRAMVFVDAISSVEEMRGGRCRVNVMDGFWHDSASCFDEIEAMVKGLAPEAAGQSKARMYKKRRMLPPGVEIPERRKAEIAGREDECSNKTPGKNRENPKQQGEKQ